MRLTSIQRLARLPQSARQAIVDECEFEHAFQGFEDGHLTAAAAAVGGIAGGGVGGGGGVVGGGGGGGLFSVRLGVRRRVLDGGLGDEKGEGEREGGGYHLD